MTDRPIVVGYDDSAGAQAALQWAVEEASRTGPRLHLVYAIEWPAHPDIGVLGRAKEVVDTAAGAARAVRPGMRITTEVVDTAATPALIEQSRNARLVVLGHRGRGGFPGLLLGSVAITATAHAHCPVVVVRPRQPMTRPNTPVVVGVDSSPESLLALAFAMQEAAAHAVALIAIHGWTPDPAGRHTEMKSAARSALTAMVNPWREKYPDVPVATRLTTDGVANALISASNDAQLVVVGSRGRGGFGGLLLGSVSQQLLHHAACPVAVLRHVAHDAPDESPPWWQAR
ncbi:universal stress protein [Phytohabitans rumicis]|uniref:Universal stress protein n=1 Tax=Phytohabitans rumicis TaxID=1076125 RepID=A0A6V8LRC3_9ACTN|nr:universal stress protein [Phytohabitans rumicis]GFJ96677.1 universal stress protein [Phytohabitans rumicis]